MEISSTFAVLTHVQMATNDAFHHQRTLILRCARRAVAICYASFVGEDGDDHLNRFGFCFDVRFHQKYFVAMQDRFEGVVTNRSPPWRSRCSCHCPDESGQSSSSWVQNQIALNNQGNRWSEEPTIACSPPMLNMMEVRIACHGQQPAHGVDCPD